MKLIFIFFLLNLSYTYSQKSKIDFCDLYNADQSNLRIDSLNNKENLTRKNKRHKIFKKNFRILIRSIDEKNYIEQECFNDFRLATLIHIAQSYPSKIFNKKIIKKLKIEIENNRIKKETLTAVIWYYSKLNISCHKYLENVLIAIKEWKINDNYENSYFGIINKSNFISCEK